MVALHSLDGDADPSEYSVLSTQEGDDYEHTLAEIFRSYGYAVQTNVYYFRSGESWMSERDTGSLHSARKFSYIMKEKSQRIKSTEEIKNEMQQHVTRVRRAGFKKFACLLDEWQRQGAEAQVPMAYSRTEVPMHEVDILIEPLRTTPVPRRELAKVLVRSSLGEGLDLKEVAETYFKNGALLQVTTSGKFTQRRRRQLQRQDDVAAYLQYKSLFFFNGDDLPSVRKQVGDQAVWFHKTSVRDFHILTVSAQNETISALNKTVKQLERGMWVLLCVAAVVVAWMCRSTTS